MRLPAWLARHLPGRAAAGRRRFDAAQYNRLTHSWAESQRSINTELRADLDALRRRARDLAKNSPLAKKFLQMVVGNIAGPKGFAHQARVVNPDGTPDKLANDAIEAAWSDWGRAAYCDVGRRLSFRQLTQVVARGIARDGEALVRIVEGAPNPYGYALQVLDIERLDTTFNREAGEGKNQIIMGVELDANGAPVAYHLATAALGRDPTAKKLQRIPATQILHLFVTDDPEQVRGIPWMHAVMLTVNDLKGYNHAAIVAARIGASKMGFFTNPDGGTDAIADGEDASGAPFTQAEPGQFGMLPPGYDFKSFDPDYPHANYAAFVKEHKRDVASGFGVAYNTLANDLEGVNFSSIRSGTLEERDNWMLAQEWLIESLLDPIYSGWLDAALLAGAIRMPNGSALPASKRAKFAAHNFQGRRWSWVDPLKDIQASVLAIENGLASPYTIAAQQGLDAEDVLDDIARFQAAASARNVTLGKPAPAPAAPTQEQIDQADATKQLTLAMVRAASTPPAAPAPNHITVAPVIHTPEVRHDVTIAVPPAPTSEIRVDVAAPNVTIQPAAVEVNLEARMPDQAAPVVEVNVELPAEMKTTIVGMPTRQTTSSVDYNAQGDIIKTTQIETDVAAAK